MLDLKPRDHVTPALRELHWLPVVQRIEYKLCLLVHKALIGQAPDYITYRGSAVERWSLTGELSLSCDRPTADG